jgi:hypothetical protein
MVQNQKRNWCTGIRINDRVVSDDDIAYISRNVYSNIGLRETWEQKNHNENYDWKESRTSLPQYETTTSIPDLRMLSMHICFANPSHLCP